MSGHLDGPPPGPPDPPYIPGDLGAPSAKEFARRRAGDRHMNDNPYPNASDTMHYELHTAWDEGYAEGFAAGRAAATPACDHPPYGPKSPCPECRAAATPDPPGLPKGEKCPTCGLTRWEEKQVAGWLEAARAASPDERLREAAVAA